MTTLSFTDQLAWITDRSDALRLAAATAGLDARVPDCPDWSVADLVTHLAEVHLFWTAVVAAGPAAGPPDPAKLDRQQHGELLEWSAGATEALTGALRDAGPDRECWTWWGSAGAPMTAGAVARHQVQEAAVHALDAQQAAGRPEPLPAAVAADGVAEHLTVELPTNGSWPHDPARVVLDAAGGGSWLVDLGRHGARVSQLADTAVPAAAKVTASPADLVLAFYRRRGHGDLRVIGDTKVFQRLLEWPNLD